MASVKTYKELEKALMKARDKALKGTSEKAVDIVKDRVDKDVYAVGTPVIYERTYQLRERLDVTKFESNGSVAEATIGHDTSKMTSVSYLGQHASLVDGSSSVDSIAEIVHNGLSGHIVGTGFWTKPRRYMFNAQQELENGKYKKFMIEQLKKQGLDAK